jgi:hypothetical protein
MGRIVAERRSRMKVFALSLALSSFLAVAAVLPGPAWTAEKGPASEALQPGAGSAEISLKISYGAARRDGTA